ncbi:lymphotoxin-beta isoform X2 [Protopterus annectens]|uniref:lymphotoxin-beta isoform X2 n=1 Tax=Protopterus annectens TaxID=7888 RepID=UPI001CFA7A38|nr:lymphotoxin-beta isoform X2 [Protopterus annectens]
MQSQEKKESSGSRTAVVICAVVVTLLLSVPTTALLSLYFTRDNAKQNASVQQIHDENSTHGVAPKNKTLVHTHRIQWQSTAGHAFIRNEIQYSPSHSIVIPQQGLYYVYCQVGFRGKGCHKGIPFTLTNQVFHEHDSYPQPILLLAGIETVCGNEQFAKTWYTALTQGALVHLDKNHHLYVNVSHPLLVNYEDGKTFFGAVQIS